MSLKKAKSEPVGKTKNKDSKRSIMMTLNYFFLRTIFTGSIDRLRDSRG